MSRLLHLSVWLDGAALGPADLRRVLESVRRRSRVEEAVFRELRVRDRDRKNVVAASPLETSEAAAVLAALPDAFAPSLAIQVECTEDLIRFDERSRTLVEDRRPLEVDVYGPEYGWRGLYFKTFGPLQLSWYSTKNFGIPAELVAEAREDGGATFLQMIVRLRENYGRVLALARDLIAALDPRHLLVYTEADVHPLTSHTIYHRDIADFGRDLDRIVTLHRTGGVYFTDVAPDDPAFAPPRGPSRNYGYLRSELGPERADEIAERIDAAAARHESGNLTPEVIVETVIESASTDAEIIGDGLLLTSKDAPFDYVEEPYFLLFDAASTEARPSPPPSLPPAGS